MQTLFSPLFQPLVILRYPIRYLLILFLITFGAFHLVNDAYLYFAQKEFMDLQRIVVFPVILSIVLFISKYQKQKKMDAPKYPILSKHKNEIVKI